MGTVVSKRKNSEVSDSAAVKIRVVAAFQNNCKDNSRDKEGQSSSSVNEAATTDDDDTTTSLQIKPSVANTKFPKGVYPQRESKQSMNVTGKDDGLEDDVQPYRLKLGVVTSTSTLLYSNVSHDAPNTSRNASCDAPNVSHDLKHDNGSIPAVVQLHPHDPAAAAAGKGDAKVQEDEKIPDELDWLLKKGVTGAEMHKAATVIQKTIRGYNCRRKLIKEVNSAALIQRSFRQWRKNSTKMLLQRSNDEHMFIPANSIANTEHHDSVDHMHQLQSVDEHTVKDIDNGQQINNTSSTSLTNILEDNVNSKTNSDIVGLLKEVCSMVAPDLTEIELPDKTSTIDVKLLGDRTREHLNTLYRSTILKSAKAKALAIGKEQFKMYLEFQNEIDETMFLAQQKAELCLGESYIPRKILLISSRVPKVTLLQFAILPDVITFVYDFDRATYFELINKIANALDDYKQGAKIKNLGIICKGGPGHLYLFANKPVTPVKLFKDHKMMTFWKVLGAMMSKLVPEETDIHFMESNVNGNKQGDQLLKDIEKLMYPSKVNVKCPLEMSASGQMMISTYFSPPKYRLWKQNRYTKLKLY